MVYQNVDSNPRENFVSINSPVTSVQAAGPNGRNTLDPDAHGAIAGLDPREVVAWSLDGGDSWGWGREVGAGPIPGDYTMSGDDAVKLPWYSWQEPGSGAMHSNQPYYAYHESGRYTVKLRSAPQATTLTEAGGYGPEGKAVGVVTVRNLRTGAVGHTSHLGNGMVKGALDPPVVVGRGDSYEISNSGTVAKAEGDLFLQKMGLIGRGETPVRDGRERVRPRGAVRAATPLVRGRRECPGSQDCRARRSRLRITRQRAAPSGRRSRRFSRARRLRVRGGIEHARVRTGHRVVVKALLRGRWRVIGRSRVRRGHRFVITRPTRMARQRRVVSVRARGAGVGRSRNVRMALR